jgi:hypothetical protein
MSRCRTRYQPEPDPVQPIFLTTDPTGRRHAGLPIGTLMHDADRTRQQTNLPPNLAETRQLIRPQPSRQSAPLPCHISTDALLRIGRNTTETNMAVTSTPPYSLSPRAASYFTGMQPADNSCAHHQRAGDGAADRVMRHRRVGLPVLPRTDGGLRVHGQACTSRRIASRSTAWSIRSWLCSSMATNARVSW